MLGNLIVTGEKDEQQLFCRFCSMNKNSLIPSLIPNKLDPYIKDLVIKFAYENEESFTWNFSNTVLKTRRFCNLNKIQSNLSNTIENYSKELFNQLNMINTLTEPLFGNFVGVHLAGGSVHSHTDFAINNYNHIRLNFLVSKPYSGGMPILSDKEYFVDEDFGWINVANKWKHASTVVSGTKPRIILSLGKYVIKQESDHFGLLLEPN